MGFHIHSCLQLPKVTDPSVLSNLVFLGMLYARNLTFMRHRLGSNESRWTICVLYLVSF